MRYMYMYIDMYMYVHTSANEYAGVGVAAKTAGTRRGGELDDFRGLLITREPT